MKKSLIAVLLLVALMTSFAFALTGCAGFKFTEFELPEGGYDGSEVTVTFHHTMGSNLTDVLDIHIGEFNKLFPKITIVHKQVGGYDDVLKGINTAITVGNHPSMAYCYPDHVASYNLAGAVVTLDELIASTIKVEHADGSDAEVLGLTDEQIADFISGYYEEGREFGDGLMYTLPLSKSTEVLYYNKTFFDECQAIYNREFELNSDGSTKLDADGNPVRNPHYKDEDYNIFVPTTWEDLKLICRRIISVETDKLTPEQIAKGEKANVIPLGYDSEANWFITMCEQYGTPYTSASGDHFLFDTEENRAFVEEFRSWYQEGLVTTQEILGSYTSSLFTATSGTRSYMSIGSSAGATHQRPTANTKGEYPFEVGIAPIPQVDHENPKAISQGPSLCIFKKDNPQEVVAAWLFTKYLATNVEFQAEFSMASGYVPVIKSVEDNPYYANFLSKADGGKQVAALSAKVCLEEADSYYTSPAFSGSSVAREQVGALMQACFINPDNGDVKAMIKKVFEDAVQECIYNS